MIFTNHTHTTLLLLFSLLMHWHVCAISSSDDVHIKIFADFSMMYSNNPVLVAFNRVGNTAAK